MNFFLSLVYSSARSARSGCSGSGSLTRATSACKTVSKPRICRVTQCSHAFFRTKNVNFKRNELPWLSKHLTCRKYFNASSFENIRKYYFFQIFGKKLTIANNKGSLASTSVVTLSSLSPSQFTFIQLITSAQHYINQQITNGAKQVQPWTPQGHRGKGQLRGTWKGDLEWISGFRFSRRKMKVAAQDRAGWRRLVGGLCPTGSDKA